jgi:hypothetical protein
MKTTRKPGLGVVFTTWWPLALSWILMGAEMPALSAVVARLPQPEVNLAAYGGVVFPLALIIESPVIMLLAASTALSRDWEAYTRLRGYMMKTGLALTILHVLVAFTPLYDVVVGKIIGVPVEIIEPARIGLQIMTPWTWAIAYRRFHQGVLIRFGHSRTVGAGTLVRLGANVAMLLVGYSLGSLPGIAVATLAMSAGVMVEAIFVALVVRPVLRNEVRLAPPAAQRITLPSFLEFYIPLAMTSLITLLAQPIGSAALSRMPLALESLAVWPVISGLIFLFRSAGVAYNEVVVAVLDKPGSSRLLRRFATLLSLALTGLLLLMTATPLSRLWFGVISALPENLANLAQNALWLALPLPALSVLQSLYQGLILHGRRTQGVTESVAVYLLVNAALLGAGVIIGRITGLYTGLFSLVISTLVQTIWLWQRSRTVWQTVLTRDAQAPEQAEEQAAAV